MYFPILVIMFISSKRILLKLDDVNTHKIIRKYTMFELVPTTTKSWHVMWQGRCAVRAVRAATCSYARYYWAHHAGIYGLWSIVVMDTTTDIYCLADTCAHSLYAR